MEKVKHAKLIVNQLIEYSKKYYPTPFSHSTQIIKQELSLGFEEFRKNYVKNDIKRFENILKKMKQIEELENRLYYKKKKKKKI